MEKCIKLVLLIRTKISKIIFYVVMTFIKRII